MQREGRLVSPANIKIEQCVAYNFASAPAISAKVALTKKHLNTWYVCEVYKAKFYLRKLDSTCRAITAFDSRIARPSSPVCSKHSLATLAQSSLRAHVVALCVCLSASFGVHGI